MHTWRNTFLKAIQNAGESYCIIFHYISIFSCHLMPAFCIFLNINGHLHHKLVHKKSPKSRKSNVWCWKFPGVEPRDLSLNMHLPQCWNQHPWAKSLCPHHFSTKSDALENMFLLIWCCVSTPWFQPQEHVRSDTWMYNKIWIHQIWLVPMKLPQWLNITTDSSSSVCNSSWLASPEPATSSLVLH